MRDVRLVYPITEEGRTREVIVDRMHIGMNGKRTIPGLGITIEDPRTKNKNEDDESVPEMLESDTPRITSELETWHPTLETPPFPMSVIDELRGKYSRFRTRHSDEYIAEQLAKDEKMEVKKKAIALTQTPTQEFLRLQRAETRKVAAQKVLTDNVLALLGEHMSRKTLPKNS
jgi:large subunit ribosomal protein L24